MSAGRTCVMVGAGFVFGQFIWRWASGIDTADHTAVTVCAVFVVIGALLDLGAYLAKHP